ncbi:MAG: acetylglutamate kinase [Candidatus Methylacidiphilales bacterium]|nr:acetylglutamate kinase [Candidatus Methylacidiphilales bacterium]
MDSAQLAAQAAVLIEALPYIQRFRGQTFVIKYGGAAMEDPELVPRVLRDIVFLEAVGINPVIVHGGGKAINRRLEENGVQARFVAGLRVTDAETVQVVDEVLSSVINPDIVEGLQRSGGRACSFNGRSVFRARKAAPVLHGGAELDLGFVGDVLGCQVLRIIQAVHDEVVPVISPLGEDENHQPYNINADVAAAEMAIALEASKIIYLSDVNGILRDPRDPESRLPTLTPEGVAALKADGTVSGGMLPKVDSCLKALEHGIDKVHLIDGRIPHALLLELFTDKGIGTEIVRG